MHWHPVLGFILLVIIGLAIIVARGINRKRMAESPDEATSSEKLPYVVCDSLLTPAEQSFYQVLRLALPVGLQILIKPRLADILQVEPGLTQSERRTALNRISQKHADFVICTLAFVPELVIELDDGSHNRADRISRDDLVDRIYAAAGLPVLHQPAQHAYTVTDLRTSLTNRRKTQIASV